MDDARFKYRQAAANSYSALRTVLSASKYLYECRLKLLKADEEEIEAKREYMDSLPQEDVPLGYFVHSKDNPAILEWVEPKTAHLGGA